MIGISLLEVLIQCINATKMFIVPLLFVIKEEFLSSVHDQVLVTITYMDKKFGGMENEEVGEPIYTSFEGYKRNSDDSSNQHA